MTDGRIKKPFTESDVQKLNQWQKDGKFHPFTCGSWGCRELLVATVDGWVCPNCDYTQDWAHDFMVSQGE